MARASLCGCVGAGMGAGAAARTCPRALGAVPGRHWPLPRDARRLHLERRAMRRRLRGRGLRGLLAARRAGRAHGPRGARRPWGGNARGVRTPRLRAARCVLGPAPYALRCTLRAALSAVRAPRSTWLLRGLSTLPGLPGQPRGSSGCRCWPPWVPQQRQHKTSTARYPAHKAPIPYRRNTTNMTKNASRPPVIQRKGPTQWLFGLPTLRRGHG